MCMVQHEGYAWIIVDRQNSVDTVNAFLWSSKETHSAIHVNEFKLQSHSCMSDFRCKMEGAEGNFISKVYRDKSIWSMVVCKRFHFVNAFV